MCWCREEIGEVPGEGNDVSLGNLVVGGCGLWWLGDGEPTSRGSIRDCASGGRRRRRLSVGRHE